MFERRNEVNFFKDIFKDLGIECFDILKDFVKEEYVKIEDSIAERINLAIRMIPELIINSFNSDTYRVVYDKGLGVLQQAANNPGMLRANIVEFGTNNRIKGEALLQKLSTGPQVISGILSAMSFVSAQYYLTRINSKLSNIEKRLAEVQEFLEDEKKSKMESEEEFLKNIQLNYQSIIVNNDLRISTLCSVQRIKMDSLANIIFYKKQIGDLKKVDIAKDKADEVLKNIDSIIYLISEYWYSLYLYSSASCIEPVISKNYDSNYIASITGDLKEKCDKYKDDYDSWKNKLEEYIQSAKAFDENRLIKAIRIIGDGGNRVGFPLMGLMGLAADIADTADKKKKKEKQDKAFDQLESITPYFNIEIIEAKRDELKFYEKLNNGKTEIVCDKGDMYFKVV